MNIHTTRGYLIYLCATPHWHFFVRVFRILRFVCSCFYFLIKMYPQHKKRKRVTYPVLLFFVYIFLFFKFAIVFEFYVLSWSVEETCALYGVWVGIVARTGVCYRRLQTKLQWETARSPLEVKCAQNDNIVVPFSFLGRTIKPTLQWYIHPPLLYASCLMQCLCFTPVIMNT